MATRKGPGKKTPAPAPRLGHGEYVVYPGGPTAIYDLLERLSTAAGDSPDFGTPGISLDRKRLTVRWFGDLPTVVQQVVAAAGQDFTVLVQPTDYRPGDLRAEAARLADAHPDVVAAATARPEGNGIEVLVPPAVAEAAGGPQSALAGLTSPFPLFAEVGEAPAP